MLPLLPIISGLASIAPTIGKWIAGEKGGERAREIADLACSVAGVGDPQSAVDAINADPKLAAEFNLGMKDLELKFYEAETERQRVVNATIVAEYAVGGDVQTWKQFLLAFWKSGWRPWIGWVFGLSLGFYTVCTCTAFLWAVFKAPDNASAIFKGLADLASALSVTWGSCMIVLGVAVKKRSDDKAAGVGAGLPQPNALKALGKKLFGGAK